MNRRHYQVVDRAIRFLDAHADAQPGLAEIAQQVGMSEYHLQKVFTEWAGISPKRFLQVLTRNRARQWLRQSRPVIDTALAAGLSGSSRLHDLFVQCDGVTPGEVARLGSGLILRFAFVDTTFGRALAATSDRGLCHLRFVDSSDSAALVDFREEWPLATLCEDPQQVAGRVHALVMPDDRRTHRPLGLWLKGTNFQVQVWQALLRIPEGAVLTYSRLADHLGQPGAARAVGNAVGKNPLAWVIPCHRVIRETGALGDYRWGEERKRVMLGLEACRKLDMPSAISGA